MCGARRFKSEIREFAKELKAQGVFVYEPFLTNFDWAELEKQDPLISVLVATGLTLHHIEFIRKADVTFVYNKGGYAGNSVTLEVGAAAALHKSIYALEHDEELCRQVLYSGEAKTPKALIGCLQ